MHFGIIYGIAMNVEWQSTSARKSKDDLLFLVYKQQSYTTDKVLDNALLDCALRKNLHHAHEISKTIVSPDVDKQAIQQRAGGF